MLLWSSIFILFWKYVAFRCLCYPNYSISPPFEFASGDNVLSPAREDKMKSTSAYSTTLLLWFYIHRIFHVMNLVLLQRKHLEKLIFVCPQENTQIKQLQTVTALNATKAYSKIKREVWRENLFNVLQRNGQSFKVNYPTGFSWHVFNFRQFFPIKVDSFFSVQGCGGLNLSHPLKRVSEMPLNINQYSTVTYFLMVYAFSLFFHWWKVIMLQLQF